jgi:hypothetical protein
VFYPEKIRQFLSLGFPLIFLFLLSFQGKNPRHGKQGVKITPPPILAITEIMAMATLSIKNPNRINTIVLLTISPEDTCCGIARDNIPSPAKERITEPTIMMDSSQGD